jgi:hypothetical protein
VLLQCDGLYNPIFEGVRSITLDNGKVTVLEELLRGAYVPHLGVKDHATNDSFVYLLDKGQLVTIPNGLENGTTKEARVSLASAEYPDVGVQCSSAQ